MLQLSHYMVFEYQYCDMAPRGWNVHAAGTCINQIQIAVAHYSYIAVAIDFVVSVVAIIAHTYYCYCTTG